DSGQFRHRKAHHVPEIAFDRLHQSGPSALDRVTARPVAPFATFDVVVDLPGLQAAEANLRHGKPGLLRARPAQHDPPVDLVRAPREALQVSPRLALAHWLAEDAPIEDHLRVASEDAFPIDRPRLAARVLDDDMAGVAARQL